jgi:hypothetical protein
MPEPIVNEISAKITIHEGNGPMLHLTTAVADSQTDDYTLEWMRIIPLGMKLWIKKDGKTVRTVILDERALMEDMAMSALHLLNAEVQA